MYYNNNYFGGGSSGHIMNYHISHSQKYFFVFFLYMLLIGLYSHHMYSFLQVEVYTLSSDTDDGKEAAGEEISTEDKQSD